jgi:signal transduction histidine kinase
MATTGYRRSTRDWVVDTILFLFAALLGLFIATTRLDAPVQLVPTWLLVVDQVVGAAGRVALWWRRRWPVEIAVALVVISVLSEVISGAMLVALFSVAVHRPPRTSLLVFGLSLLAAVGYIGLHPEPDLPQGLVLALSVALQGAATGWGLFVHHRRQLVLSLRDRAERAEAEARLRAEQAQHHARAAIAREIHDVLATVSRC